MAKKPRVRTASAEAESESGDGYWVVGLKYNKRCVVEASSEYQAIERYKEVMGIKSSDHEFKAVFLPDGYDHLEVDEFGVVTGDTASNVPVES